MHTSTLDTLGFNPIVGTAGHMSGGAVQMNANQEIARLKTLFLKGCPVNRRTPTKMTRRSFEQNCLTFQKRAGVLDPPTKVINGSTSTPAGWRTNNINICNDCETGEGVRTDEEYEAPLNISFITQRELKSWA